MVELKETKFKSFLTYTSWLQEKGSTIKIKEVLFGDDVLFPDYQVDIRLPRLDIVVTYYDFTEINPLFDGV